MKPNFKIYLLNESKSHLGQKIGDILTALQSLSEDSPHLGSRQLLQASKGIANQIRKTVKDDWPDTETATLRILQKVGIALMKAIDENGDLKDVIPSAVQELQKASSDLGEPVNDLGSQDNPQD